MAPAGGAAAQPGQAAQSKAAAQRRMGSWLRERRGQPATVHGPVAPKDRARPGSPPLAHYRTRHGLPLPAGAITASGPGLISRAPPYQGTSRPSRGNMPVGPPLGMVTAHTTLAAPCAAG